MAGAPDVTAADLPRRLSQGEAADAGGQHGADDAAVGPDAGAGEAVIADSPPAPTKKGAKSSKAKAAEEAAEADIPAKKARKKKPKAASKEGSAEGEPAAAAPGEGEAAPGAGAGAADAEPGADAGPSARRRGFTAVNSPEHARRVLPLAAPHAAAEDAAGQLLIEAAAAYAGAQTASTPSPAADGAADQMDIDVPETVKKRKRKDKGKAAAAEPSAAADIDGENDTEAGSLLASSTKKQKTQKSKSPLVWDPDADMPAPKSSKKANGKQKKGQAAAEAELEPSGQEQSTPAEHEDEAPVAEASQPSEQQPTSRPGPPATPSRPPVPSFLDSTPIQTPTPSKRQSKVAIAYERKKRRLEAAAQAAAQAQPEASSASQPHPSTADMDIPDDPDDIEEAPGSTVQVPSSQPEPPKSSTKRKKRRMPDLAPAATALSGTPTSKSTKKRIPKTPGDENEDPQSDNGAPSNTPARKKRTTPSKRQKRDSTTGDSARKPSATPLQPGTTSVSRVRPSYTYAPDPAPSTPPSTGTFTQPECTLIDDYLTAFSNEHSLTQTQLNARIWGDATVVPDQSKADREAFWRDLYGLLPHRKRLAIYNHVRRRYHNFGTQGAKWDEDQDRELQRLVLEKGSKWTTIGTEMGRLPDDCRDRWRNYLKCGMVRREKEWTDEEEALLRKVVREVRERMKALLAPEDAPHPASQVTESGEPAAQVPDEDVEINWTVVSELMGGWRSRIQCRYKWSKLMEWEGRHDDKAGESGVGVEGTPKRAKKPRKTSTPGKVKEKKGRKAKSDEVVADEDDENFDGEGAATTEETVKERKKRERKEKKELKDKEKKEKKEKSESTKKPRAKKDATAPSSSSAAVVEKKAETGPKLTPFAQMKTGDRILLLKEILSHDPATPITIPWEEIATAINSPWPPSALEAAFIRLVRTGIRKKERAGLSLVEGVNRLLGDLEELPEFLKEERWAEKKGEDEVVVLSGDEDIDDDEDEGDEEEQEKEEEEEDNFVDEAPEDEEAEEEAQQNVDEDDGEKMGDSQDVESLARMLLSQVQEAYKN